MIKKKIDIMEDIKNPPKKVYRYSNIMALIFLVAMIYGITISDRVGMDIWAFVFISFFLFICSIVASIVFYRLSKEISTEIKLGRNIATFNYTISEWKKIKDIEYNFRKNEKTAIFIFLSVFSSIIFLLFILVIPDGKLFMFLVLIFLIIFYSFFAFIIPFIVYKLTKDRCAKIIIFSKGILYDNSYHSWNMPLSKLIKVNEIKKPNHELEITYSFFDRLGPRQYSLYIPILKKHETDIKKIISRLWKYNRKSKKGKR